MAAVKDGGCFSPVYLVYILLSSVQGSSDYGFDKKVISEE